ncbi:uncharacterized protein LOC128145747 isoform X2 [Harpia harpyja]|uniref:uncharacterized protein LOC128145747 isoform X2 n=1 Tax=Harpia harpyja TaxID=202280 RepID=UPI0022B1E755|nr:uncharacterized protein LOC128145747 isoform X2 [Harpia harpyja]
MAAPRARASASAGERQDHRGCAEDAFVRSSPGDAVDCTRFRLVWADSAWSCSPRSMGAKRDRRSAYWLWAGAAAAVAGEARERGSIEDLVVDSSLGMLLTVSGSGAAVAEAREARRSAYTESRSFLLLTPPHQQGGWGGTRSSEGTQLGQLMPTDPRDIPDHMTSCSAYKDGQGIAAVSVVLYWTGWNSSVNSS